MICAHKTLRKVKLGMARRRQLPTPAGTDRVGTATKIRRAARLGPPVFAAIGGLDERPEPGVSGEH
jgi:hypothetical protein